MNSLALLLWVYYTFLPKLQSQASFYFSKGKSAVLLHLFEGHDLGYTIKGYKEKKKSPASFMNQAFRPLEFCSTDVCSADVL